MSRKGAKSRAAIPPELLAALNEGRAAAATLAECLAVDHPTLLRVLLPAAPAAEIAAAATGGITRRIAACGAILLAHTGSARAASFVTHPSDTVRGSACFAVAARPGLALEEHLRALRPFADDPHFGVREWAWLALRPLLAEDVHAAIRLLVPWTAEASANLRRFAVEATRPRGVWAAHLAELKRDPAPGLALLEPLRADPARYVQDSVANWINDAAKDRPDWARELVARWQRESDAPATARICARALRSAG